MATGSALMSGQRWFAMGKETTRGTPVAVSAYIPIDKNPKLTTNVTWLPDKGMRGAPAIQFGDVPGYRHDEFDFKGNVFADTFPNIMEGLLGAPDTVTGSAAPYTHKIGLQNAPTTGSQPPSYTINDVDYHAQSGGAAKQAANSMIDSVSISFTADGAMTYSAKSLSNAFSEIAVPTWGGSTELFIPAWNSVVLTGTIPSSVVMSGSIDMKRNTKVIQTMGQQSPFAIFSDGIEVSGKFKVLAQPNDVWFADSLVSFYQALTFTLTEPVSSHSVAFQMSKVQLKNPVIDSSEAWLKISLDFTAEANTTDAVLGSFSPILFTAVNGQAAAYA